MAATRLIVLRAETQQACIRIGVNKHGPGTAAINQTQKAGLEDAVQQASRLVQMLDKSNLAYDPSQPVMRIERWLARGQIAFYNQPLDPMDASDVSTAAARLKVNSPSQPQTADEAAAVIRAIELLGIHDGGQGILSEVLHVARPHARNARVWFQSALALEEKHTQDAYSAARGATQLLISKHDAMSALSHTLMARLALQLNDIPSAHEAIEVGLTIWGDEPAWHMLAAQICQHSDRQSEQLMHLEQAVQLDPKSAVYNLELGKTYLDLAGRDRNQITHAIRAFESATHLNPSEVIAWIWLARAQLRAGQLEEATISIDRVLTLSPENPDATILQAEIALQNKSYQAAHDLAQTAVQAHPEDTETTLTLAKTLNSLNRSSEALEVLETAIPTSKDSLKLQYERANILRDLQGPEAALKVLTELVNDYPEDANILTSLARNQSELGDQQAAIQTVLTALEAGKTSLDSRSLANIHFLAGTLLRQTGQQDQAIAHLNQAVSQAPDMLEAYLELGMARKERREYQQALQSFEQAATLAPQDPRPHYLAGLALKEGKDYRRSELMLRQAAHLAPDDVVVRRQLAHVVALNVVHNPRV